MNQIIKRTLSLVLALLLIFALFVGCSNDKTTDETTTKAETTKKGETTKATTATTTTEAVDEYNDDPGVSYTIEWQGSNYFEVPADAPLKLWLEEKYNVKFNLGFLEPTNREELLNLKLASKEIPDIWQSTNRTEVAKYVQQGLIAEIPEAVIRKNAPEFSATLDELGAITWFYNQVDGKNYAIPGFNYLNVFQRPIVWRGDWLEKVGITKVPETLAEFEDAFYKFAKEDPDGNGKDDTFGLSNGGLNSIYGAFGFMPDFVEKTSKVNGQFALKDGKIVYGAVQPEMKDALELLHKWYMDGVLDPEFVAGEFEGSVSASLVNGRIGYTSYGNFYHYIPEGYDAGYVGPNQTKLKELQGEDANFVFGDTPVGADGVKGCYLGDVFGIHEIMGVQMEDQKGKMARIIKVVNGIYTDEETFLTVRFGFEGEHWNYNDLGNIIPDPAYAPGTNLEAFTKLGAHITFFQFWTPVTFAAGNSAWLKWTDKDIPLGVNHRNAVPTGLLPSIVQYEADLFTMTTEAYTAIITGDKDISYFDEYVKNWKAAGGDILTKEANDLYLQIQALGN